MKVKKGKIVAVSAFLLAACLIALAIFLWFQVLSGDFSKFYGGSPTGSTFDASYGIDVNFPQGPPMSEEGSKPDPIGPDILPGEKLLYGHQYRKRLIFGPPPDGGTYFWEYGGCIGTPIAYWTEGTLWIPDGQGKWQPYRPLDYTSFVKEFGSISRRESQW